VTIEIQCPACHRKLRVPEKFAGKRAKCPGCKEVVEIPAADGESGGQPPTQRKPQRPTPAQKPKEPSGGPAAPAAPSEPQWYVHTEEGDEYGPVSRQELETWVEEGRVDATCQVFCDGWPDWKWASEEFPQLAGPAATAEPAAEAAPVFTTPAEDETPAVPQLGGTGGVTTPLSRTTTRKYRALMIVATIYTVLAWVVAVLGVVGALGTLALGIVGGAPGGSVGAGLISSFVIAGLILLYAFLMAVTLKAFAELIKLAMDIQENTHLTAQAVARLAERR